MDARSDLLQRFGQEAADRMTAVMGTPNIGDPSVQPAAPERALGALMGVFKCKVSGGVRHDWHASTEMDLLTQLTLVTADSLIAGTDDHPARLAARLVGFDINTTGLATRRTQSRLRAGQPWWLAGEAQSAGAAAAARCTAFGLRWAGDPQRAAYEAAISASVTHGHPAAVAGAAAIGAGVALAASGDGPLGLAWLDEVTSICASFRREAVGGEQLIEKLRALIPLLSGVTGLKGGVTGQKSIASAPPPSSIGTDLTQQLRWIGTRPIATQAVPAALLCAIRTRVLDHTAKCAFRAHPGAVEVAVMASALVGARYGRTRPQRLIADSTTR